MLRLWLGEKQRAKYRAELYLHKLPWNLLILIKKDQQNRGANKVHFDIRTNKHNQADTVLPKFSDFPHIFAARVSGEEGISLFQNEASIDQMSITAISVKVFTSKNAQAFDISIKFTALSIYTSFNLIDRLESNYSICKVTAWLHVMIQS